MRYIEKNHTVKDKLTLNLWYQSYTHGKLRKHQYSHQFWYMISETYLNVTFLQPNLDTTRSVVSGLCPAISTVPDEFEALLR